MFEIILRKQLLCVGSRELNGPNTYLFFNNSSETRSMLCCVVTDGTVWC